MCTATNSAESRKIKAATWWLGSSLCAGASALLKLAYDKSVATWSDGEAATLYFLVLVAMVVALVALVWGYRVAGRRLLNLLAAIATFSLFAFNVMPSLVANVKANELAITRLALAVRGKRKIAWPARVGPFVFISGDVDDLGVMLHTTGEYEGDYGLIWSPAKVPDAGNATLDPVAKNLFLYVH